MSAEHHVRIRPRSSAQRRRWASRSACLAPEILKQLAARWFVVRDAKDSRGPTLLQPRWAMSYLRGPMTREEIRRARTGASATAPEPVLSASVPAVLPSSANSPVGSTPWAEVAD